MKRNLELKFLDESDKVGIYSVQFEGEEHSEFEKFILRHKDDPRYEDDLGIIFSWIKKVKNSGALERLIRYEGTMKDRVVAPIDASSLRLYCIRINDVILLLGDGGEKTTRIYQEDEFLNKCVETLQKIDYNIKKREKDKSIKIIGTRLEGDLSFSINE